MSASRRPFTIPHHGRQCEVVHAHRRGPHVDDDGPNELHRSGPWWRCMGSVFLSCSRCIQADLNRLAGVLLTVSFLTVQALVACMSSKSQASRNFALPLLAFVFLIFTCGTINYGAYRASCSPPHLLMRPPSREYGHQPAHVRREPTVPRRAIRVPHGTLRR